MVGTEQFNGTSEVGSHLMSQLFERVGKRLLCSSIRIFSFCAKLSNEPQLDCWVIATVDGLLGFGGGCLGSGCGCVELARFGKLVGDRGMGLGLCCVG